LIFALLPHTAQAALDCTVKSAQLINGHATTHLVPSSTLAIGDFVSIGNLFEITYRCKVNGAPTHWGIAGRNVTTVANTGIGAPWSAATDVHPILTTPQLQQRGLGFSGYYYHRNEWPPAHSLTNADVPAFVWKNLPAADSEGYVELGISVVYRFHKINDNLDTTGSPVTVQALPFPLAAFVIHDNQHQTIFSPIAQVTATMPTLTIAQRACTPFTNTVKLPAVNAAELNQINVGDSLPPTDFWIQMRCPSNIGHIMYYIVPVHGIANEAQGVININPASQAKGIGLQMTTRSVPDPVYVIDTTVTDYQPVKFGSTNRYWVHSSLFFGAGPNTDPLTSETDHTAPLDTIPLRVAVYRTGTVVPGTYNAAIFIHLVYR